MIETGLGGRLDATNVLKPLLTITTNIALDHSDILGNTIEEIAGEKAGIIKSGVPHLVGLLPTDAMKVMRAKCREKKTPLHRLTRKTFSGGRAFGSLSFRGNKLSFTDFSLGLSGPHQVTNAALTVFACELLRESGLRLSKAAVKRGLAKVNWPGRFQIIAAPNRPTVILDVCHNPNGAGAFAATFRYRYPGRKASIIIGLVRKKEHQEIFDALAPIANEINLVPLKSRRSANPEELIAGINWRGVPVRRFGRLRTACRHLLKSSGSDDIICVIGSHYLVGEYLEEADQA